MNSNELKKLLETPDGVFNPSKYGYNLDLVANLLAGENIEVVYSRNVQTAAFDVKKRKMYIGAWVSSIQSEAVQNFVRVHEIAHALWTPVEGYHDKVKQYGRVFGFILNVIEDYRIENLVQVRYPGTKILFKDAYRYVMLELEGSPFQYNIDTIKDMEFLGRLNMFAKGRAILPWVPFSAEEQVFVDRLDSIRSFSDVVTLSIDIHEFIKETANSKQDESGDDQQESPEDDGEPNESDDSSDQGSSDDSEDDGEPNESDDSSESDEGPAETDEEAIKRMMKHLDGATDGVSNEPEIPADFDDALNAIKDQKQYMYHENRTVKVAPINYDAPGLNVMVSNAEFVGDFAKIMQTLKDQRDSLYTTLENL